MKKIFISHSSEDKEIVGELIALIEGMGVRQAARVRPHEIPIKKIKQN